MSPIGKGLLGKKKGDLATIKTPAGEMEFEIVNITA
jgi:transcription elongation factor GreA